MNRLKMFFAAAVCAVLLSSPFVMTGCISLMTRDWNDTSYLTGVDPKTGEVVDPARLQQLREFFGVEKPVQNPQAESTEAESTAAGQPE